MTDRAEVDSSTPKIGGPTILRSQPNFRDVAGVVASAGSRLKSGTLYRSGEIVGLTGEDRGRLGALGVRTIIDLRSDAEAADRGQDEAPPGAVVVRIPIDEADRLQERLTERFASGRFGPPDDDPMVGVYRSLVGEWMPAFRRVVDILLDAELPAVVHCTHGKDRTGIASALVLAALGVERASIEVDFLESNVRRREETERLMAQLRELVAARSAEGSAPSIEWMRQLFEVDRRYLHAAWSDLDARYGSLPVMLEQSLGLTPSRLARLRGRFVG